MVVESPPILANPPLVAMERTGKLILLLAVLSVTRGQVCPPNSQYNAASGKCKCADVRMLYPNLDRMPTATTNLRPNPDCTRWRWTANPLIHATALEPDSQCGWNWLLQSLPGARHHQCHHGPVRLRGKLSASRGAHSQETMDPPLSPPAAPIGRIRTELGRAELRASQPVPGERRVRRPLVLVCGRLRA